MSGRGGVESATRGVLEIPLTRLHAAMRLRLAGCVRFVNGLLSYSVRKEQGPKKQLLLGFSRLRGRQAKW